MKTNGDCDSILVKVPSLYSHVPTPNHATNLPSPLGHSIEIRIDEASRAESEIAISSNVVLSPCPSPCNGLGVNNVELKENRRVFRSNSLIRINSDSIDNDSSYSSASDNSCPSNGNADDLTYSYPHSDNDFTSSTSDNTANKNKKLTATLLPFNHQVGGHTQLMLLDQSTLCKPLVQRELLFYLNIPRELVKYVPHYKGVVEVRQSESNFPLLYHPNKRVTATSSNAKSTSSLISSSSSPMLCHKPELRVQLCSCNDRRLLQNEFGGSNIQMSQRSECSGYSTRPSQRYFMLMENIASSYHLPCILDLKMGTRQHGDDASDEKRHRQMAKCAATTSASLGVRICGMQTYHRVADNNYRLYQVDKYYGRRIKNEVGLQNELEIYFKNRPYLIGPVIKRLRKLKSKVFDTLRKTSLRFFSTSLLIVSEGCFTAHRSRHTFKHNNSDGEEEEDDFDEDEEEIAQDSEEDEEDYDAEDELSAVYRKPQVAQEKVDKCQLTVSAGDDSVSSGDSASATSPVSSDGLKPQAAGSTPSSTVESRYVAKHFTCNRDHRRRPPTAVASSEFDVRMIDFAHTTFSSNSSSDGFLLGLDNLIRLLTNIRSGKSHHSLHKQNSTKKRRRSSHADNQSQPYDKSPSKKKESNGICSEPREFLLNEETIVEPFGMDSIQ